MDNSVLHSELVFCCIVLYELQTKLTCSNTRWSLWRNKHAHYHIVYRVNRRLENTTLLWNYIHTKRRPARYTLTRRGLLYAMECCGHCCDNVSTCSSTVHVNLALCVDYDLDLDNLMHSSQALATRPYSVKHSTIQKKIHQYACWRRAQMEPQPIQQTPHPAIYEPAVKAEFGHISWICKSSSSHTCER